MCHETLRGVQYLHSHFILHMHIDVRGANILLTENGKVKIADLGVSAQITNNRARRKSLIGLPYWIVPK